MTTRDARRLRAVRCPLVDDGEAFICSYECTFCVACTAALRTDLPELLRRARRAPAARAEGG